ncbi:MAG: AraC family transcriptional regulator [Ferruginibacter sp.]|nr:AraC family transcriptional regulator [Cytophagales bacterium]
MFYRTHAPSPWLAPFVQQYLVVGHDDPAGRGLDTWLSPGGYAALSTNVGTATSTVDNARFQALRLPSIGYAAGQQTRPFRMHLHAGVHYLHVKFQPDGFFRLTGIPGRLVLDDHVPLEELRGIWPTDLIERLTEAPDDAGRVRLLDDHLLRRLANRSFRPDATRYALQRIDEGGGTGSIEELARGLRVSRRHLDRLFNEHVGVSPKFYARTVRFNCLSQSLWTPQPSNYQDLVHRLGFYDQAHLIKEMRFFTGMNPSLAIQHPRLNEYLLRT